MLSQLARMLDDETIKAEVAEVVAAEVKYLRFVGLDNVAGRYATEMMVSGVVRLVGEMGAIPRIPCACVSTSLSPSSSAACSTIPRCA